MLLCGYGPARSITRSPTTERAPTRRDESVTQTLGADAHAQQQTRAHGPRRKQLAVGAIDDLRVASAQRYEVDGGGHERARPPSQGELPTRREPNHRIQIRS